MEAIETERGTYEKIYFSLWETGQRYASFTQFRVIGKSHDDRMIPMLEVGQGNTCIFCLAGLDGGDNRMPSYLLQMAEDYCQFYECEWIMDECYQVRSLLDHVRICFIPLLNPDGYEICRNGYTVIRNPVFRQMLRMQNCPHQSFICNARGIDLKTNFPTNYYVRKQIHQEPASENETKAVIHMFQEYRSAGLLSFGLAEKRIVYYKQNNAFSYNQKSCRMARHLLKHSGSHLEREHRSNGSFGLAEKRIVYYKQNNAFSYNQKSCRMARHLLKHSGSHLEREHRSNGDSVSEKSTGSVEQFYAEVIRQPSLMIELPVYSYEEAWENGYRKKEYSEISLLPLEYIHSLGHI